jgi:hypothetical protein
VTRLLFGAAVATRQPDGGEGCEIARPLPEPVAFPAGATSLSFVLEVDPETVRQLEAHVDGDFTGARGVSVVGCNAFAVRQGRVAQTQYGGTVSRNDRGPFRGGTYRLVLCVNEASPVELPFEVR